MNSKSVSTVIHSGERFFRLYHKHCVEPDLDTLFNLLNAIHSLNDKINNSMQSNFFDCNEFISLKALRNLFHHGEELIDEVRIIPAEKLPPLFTDLLYLCLIPRLIAEKAIQQISKKRRERDEKIIRKTFKWYGNVVNINPCIFNFAVHAYEKVQSLNIALSGDEFELFKESYDYENQYGHLHFVSGDINCHVGSMDEILNIAYADVSYS